MSSLPASIKRIGSKMTEKRWRHRFPHYKSMGAFCSHGNQSFDPICSKTLCSFSPTPVMLHIKFDQDWPTGYRDIQVWKCGRRRTPTDDGPLIYYKLTLWAFGSGELKIKMPLKSSLASHFWDIGKQCRPRSDECSVWSGSSLFANRNIYWKWKWKGTSDTLNIGNELSNW